MMTEQQAKCKGTRKNGQACGAFALASGYCFSHDPQRTQERQAARAKGSRVAGQMRKLRGKRARLDSLPGLVRFTSEVIQGVLDGRVEVGVGRCVLYGVSIQRQLLETGDLERRIAALEEKLVGRASGQGSKHNGDARHANSEFGEAGTAL